MEALLELLPFTALDLVMRGAKQKLGGMNVVLDGLSDAQLETLQHARGHRSPRIASGEHDLTDDGDSNWARVQKFRITSAEPDRIRSPNWSDQVCRTAFRSHEPADDGRARLSSKPSLPCGRNLDLHPSPYPPTLGAHSRRQGPVQHRSLFLLFAIVGWWFAVTARADAGARAVFVWERAVGAESCSEGEVIADAVETRLGRAVWATNDQGERIVHVRLEKATGPGFEIEIRLLRPNGEVLGVRRFSSEGLVCSALDESIALILALILDPSHAVFEAVSPPEEDRAVRKAPLPESQGGSSYKETETIEEIDASRPNAKPHVEATLRHPPAFQVLWVGGYGRAPGFGAGIELAAVHVPGSLPFAFDLTLWAPRLAEADDVRGRIRFWEAGAGMHVCPIRPNSGRLSTIVCGGVQAGITLGLGHSFLESNRALRPEIDPAITFRSSYWPQARWGISFGVRVSFPLLRSRFEYLDSVGVQRTLYETPPIRVTVALGIEFGSALKKEPWPEHTGQKGHSSAP